MAEVFWRQGGPEHLGLARHLHDHDCRTAGVSQEANDTWWATSEHAQLYIDVAWAALEYVYKIHQEKRQQPQGVDPDKWVAPPPVKGTRTEPIWKQPKAPCPDGVHDFFFDSDLDILACHKCDWFEESA